MADRQPLTPDQISSFKEQGYLILRNFIDLSQIESWCEQFWKHIDADAGDPSTWPESYVIEGFSTDPPIGRLPQMEAVVEQLGGGKFEGGNGGMLLKWPKEDQEWVPSNSGHIDGYGGAWRGGFMMGAATYLHDIETKGGALLYWPRSHLSTHEYFLEFPAHIDSSFKERDDWEERTWRVFSDLSPQGPVEFTGRTGVFSNWYHADREEMRYEVPKDLWKYWGI